MTRETEERTDAPPYVLDTFAGYVRGVEGSDEPSAPPGSLRSTSANFLITSTGKLRKGFGVNHLTLKKTSGATKVRMQKAYLWKRSRGGDVVLVSGTGGSTFLATLPPGVPCSLNEGWEALPGTSGEVTQDDSKSFSPSFSAYGDWCFFSNGLDRVKKIRRHDLQTYDLGLDPPEDSDMPDVHHTGFHLCMAAWGLRPGVYQYKFTYTYARGGESNANVTPIQVEVPGDASVAEFYPAWMGQFPVVDTDDLIRNYVVLSGFPSLSDYASLRDDIQHINIYRTLADTPDVYYYVGSVPRGYTSFLDKKPDSVLGALMPSDHDLPPVARFVEMHDDRLWLMGDVQEGALDILAYSLKGYPDIVPPTYRIPQTEWANAGRGMGLVSLNGILYALFENAVFWLSGTRPEDYELRPVTTSFGVLAPETVRVYKGTLVFTSSDGVVAISGTSISSVRDLPFDLRELLWQPLTGCAAAVVDDYYVLCIPPAEASSLEALQNSRAFAVNLRNGTVGLLSVPFDFASDDGPEHYPLVGRFTNDAVSGDQDIAALGMAMRSFGGAGFANTVWDFHALDFGSPEQEKRPDVLRLDFLAHTLYKVKVTVTDEQGESKTHTEVTSADFPYWGTSNWSTSEAYPRIQPLSIRMNIKGLRGTKFWVKIEEDVSGTPRTYSRYLELIKMKFHYSWSHRK